MNFKPTTVYLDKQPIKLNDANYKTTGGQGHICVKNKTVFKIYIDPSKMIPIGKINQLMELKRDNISRPTDIFTNKRGTPLGITMHYADNMEALCKTFTKSFRKINNFTIDQANKLVDEIAITLEFIHSKKCLIVDWNEVNFLISLADMALPHFLDVDSWQTKDFPADAYSPLMTDPQVMQTKKFTELSDWFSFGILATKVYLGEHPFKGTHPKYNPKQYNDKQELYLKRMKENASIFDKGVKMPPCVRTMDHIPTNMRGWLEDIFKHGKRTLPPDMAGIVKVVAPIFKKVVSSNFFKLEKIKEYRDPIKWHFSHQGKNVVKAGYVIYIDDCTFSAFDRQMETIILPKTLEPVEADTNFAKILSSGEKVDYTTKFEQINVADNALIGKVQDRIVEINIKMLRKPILTYGTSWGVLPYATQIMNGMVYQNILGKPYILIPQNTGKRLAGQFLQIKELQGYKILYGKYMNQVAILIGNRGRKYIRFIIRFAKGMESYTIQNKTIPGFMDINFTVLRQGIGLLINENNEVEMFSNQPENQKVRVVTDNTLDGDLTLSCNEEKALVFKDNILYQFSTR